MENFVITIARGFGSNGKQIGIKLAEELGIPCYEHQILDMASEESGINAREFARVDEKLRGSYLLTALRKRPFTNVVSPSDRDFVSDVNLFNIQAEVMGHLADTESCVIVGKCADYVLRDRKNVVSLYIEAPRPYCLKQVMDRLHVDGTEAARLIVKTDKYRADYYKYYTNGRDWMSPINYDLTINSDRVGVDGAIALVKDYLKIKGFLK